MSEVRSPPSSLLSTTPPPLSFTFLSGGATKGGAHGRWIRAREERRGLRSSRGRVQPRGRRSRSAARLCLLAASLLPPWPSAVFFPIPRWRSLPAGSRGTGDHHGVRCRPVEELSDPGQNPAIWRRRCFLGNPGQPAFRFLLKLLLAITGARRRGHSPLQLQELICIAGLLHIKYWATRKQINYIWSTVLWLAQLI